MNDIAPKAKKKTINPALVITENSGQADVAALKNEFLNVFGSQGSANLVVDASGLTSLTTALAQLLISASRWAADRGKLLEITGVPEALKPQFEITGISLAGQ